MVGKFECLNFLQHKRPFSCAEQEISHHFGNPHLPGVRSFRNSEAARRGSLTREVARGHPAQKVAPRLLSVQRGRQYLPFDSGNESNLKRGIDFVTEETKILSQQVYLLRFKSACSDPLRFGLIVFSSFTKKI